MLTAFKQYLSTLKLGAVSRKLYFADVRRFLASLGSEPTLSQVASPKVYAHYLDSLKSVATAPSMVKRTLASLKQFGTFLSLTYSLPNPMQQGYELLGVRNLASTPANNYIKHFSNYLNSLHLSPLTIKSYKSDVTRYLDWAGTAIPSTNLSELLKEKNIKKYWNYLSEVGRTLPSTIERKEKSLARFQAWYSNVYAPSNIPDSIASSSVYDPMHSRSVGALHSGSVTALSPDQSLFFVKKFNYRSAIFVATLLLFTATLAVFGYRQFNRDVRLTAAYPSTPVTPNRQLSFQGRLENAGGTPITTATNFVFKLFTASSGGTELYSSGTCSIDPDNDGVFNTQIGDTCGAGIASSVFTENADVWLEVTVGAEVLDPRQQIATVAYALNSETIQGFPISSTISAIRNTVVPMNQWGEIIVGEQSPRLTGVSGTFAISAPALTLSTTSGSNGNITLAPDGTGQVNLNGNTTSTNFFNVSNAQLTTGSLITGTAANNNTGFYLLNLLSGSSPTSKFSVTDTGLTTIGADLYVSSGVSLYNNAVSDDTFEGAKFCTGDGETNCVTDFSSFATGTNYWTRSAGNISPLTLNDTISATTSAAVALTITQTGAFNALLVEDQASDTTPFVIDQSGNVGMGTTTPGDKLSVIGNADISSHAAIGASASINDTSLFYTNTETNVLTLEETFTDLSNDWTSGITNLVNLNPSANSTGAVYGDWSELRIQSGNDKNLGELSGSSGYISHRGTGTVTSAIGGNFSSTNDSSGTITEAIGVSAYASEGLTTKGLNITAANGSTAAKDIYGIYSSPQSNGVITTGTNNVYGSYTTLNLTSATGGTHNAYGDYITLTTDNAGAGTSAAYGLYINTTGSAADTNYAIYTAGSAGSIFGGDITVSGGNINTGNIPLVIGDAATDTIQLLTDGTGNGEILLPNDSIGANEILSTGQTDEYCLTFEGTPGSGTWEWQSCSAAGSGSNWRLDSLGTISPINDTLDLLVGSTATASARAGFININSGNTPTATLSAGAAGGTYLTATGTLATTAKQSLTIGNSTTGNVVIAPGGTTALTGIGANLTAAGNLTLTAASNLIFGSTTLAETTSAVDSGAFVVGTFDEYSNSASTTVQGVLNDLDAALATGGSGSMWTLASGVIYPTSATDDFAIGGTTLAASIFGIDESAGNFYFGYDNSVNPTLNFEATDADAGEFGFNTNDSFFFSNANVGIGDTSPSNLFVVGSGDLFQVDSGGNIFGPTLALGTGTIARTDRLFDINTSTALGSTGTYTGTIQRTLTGTLTGNITDYGLYNSLTVNATDGTFSHTANGTYTDAQLSNGNTIDTIRGIYAVAQNNSSTLSPDSPNNTATSSSAITGAALNNGAGGIITNQYGGLFSSYNTNTGSITNAYGSYSHAYNADATGTITTATGARARVFTNVDGAAITTAYGVYGSVDELATQTTGGITTGYGGYFNGQDATTSYGLATVGIQNTANTATFTNLYGINSDCQTNGANVTVTNCYGIRSNVIETLGNVTNGYAGYFHSSAAMTAGYGLYSNLTGAGTTNYGLYTNVSGAGTNYAIYANGTAQSYFGGSVSIAANQYLNFDTTFGSSGYGIRDNAGVMEFKSLSGAWTPMGAASASWWDQTSDGTIQPYNKTVDLILGGTATSSAKFAVLNMNSGTPTASISGIMTIGQGDYLSSEYGPLNLAYKSGLNAWTTGLLLQDTTGNVGIGIANPTQKLEVNGYVVGQRFQDSSSATYYVDPASSSTSLSIDGNIVGNGAFYLSTGADATAVSIGTTGAGKLDAGTIDPPYTINGDKFATYMSSMTGVKEETTGVVKTGEYIVGVGYRTTLDLATSPEGSDLWIFSKVSDLQNNLDKLVVLLSSSGNGQSWYEVEASAGKLHLYSQLPSTISYRLTAPRFDALSWGNTRESESIGFVINDEDTWSVPENIAAFFGSNTTGPVSPLAEDQSIAITGPVRIRGSELPSSSEPQEPTLIVDGEIEATTISARLAHLHDIEAENITARNIVADTITANHIEGLDAKIASLSAGLTDSEYETITDRIKARLSILAGNTPSAEDVPVPETNGSELPAVCSKAEDSSEPCFVPTATSSATLVSADIDFATINNYLAVIGTATITTLDVTNGLYVDSINSKTGLLALADNTMIIDSAGHVAINGDLTVSGKITASELNLERLNILDESGVTVATIDASGSANLASLTTNMITIASGGTATNSSALSSLVGTATSNATAGQSILISPQTQLTIESPYVTPNSLVYLTPTGNTDNKVLFVQSKQTCPESSLAIDPHCNRSFTVGIDAAATTDISFNWWIIQLD